MLVYESTEKLLAEPDARRYLHSVLLTAIRDKAERMEIRFGEGEGFLYYRIEGRDWELVPPPDDVYAALKDEVRAVARLVRPERPGVTLTASVEGARFEPLEVGWLTYQLGPYWLDIVVRIDPREPWGYVRFDLDQPDEFSELAGEALTGYYEALGGEDVT